MSRAFVCRCEDIDLRELHEAIDEGYDDLESLRRFTALGTGPCQGKACMAECIRILAEHHGIPEDEVGLMTMRPPVVPLPISLLAALDDDVVESMLEGDGRAAHREVRAAMDRAEADGRPRTGRPTPHDVEARR